MVVVRERSPSCHSFAAVWAITNRENAGSPVDSTVPGPSVGHSAPPSEYFRGETPAIGADDFRPSTSGTLCCARRRASPEKAGGGGGSLGEPRCFVSGHGVVLRVSVL